MHPVKKSMTRSNSDKILSGVLGGIARHYNFQALWLRILFVVGTTVSAGLFILAYIAAAFIMPKDADDNTL